MHEEQNNAPVKTVQSNRQEANFPNLEEKENLKQLLKYKYAEFLPRYGLSVAK